MPRSREDRRNFAAGAEVMPDEPIIDLIDGLNIYTDGSYTAATDTDFAKSVWGFVFV